jgi:hypothetical protein
VWENIFSSPCQRQCELLPSLGVHRLSSVNFSHFNLGDNGKSYLSINSLMAKVISLLTVYYNGEVFLEMNQSETRIACGSHVC